MSISCRGHRGFTLPELLVCMFCLSIILVAFTAFFLSSMKGYTAINAQQEVQSSVVTGIDSIIRDFKETSKNTSEIFVNCSASSQCCFYFPSPRNWKNRDYIGHSEGAPWPSWVIYYQTLDKKSPSDGDSYVLVRNQQQDKPDISFIPTLTSGLIRGKIIARSLKKFEVQADLTSAPPGYKVSISARKKWKQSSYEFSLQKTFYINDLHNI